MTVPNSPRFAFGGFQLDAYARELHREDGTRVALTPKVFDTLLYFVEHAGVALSKDQLMTALWPGRIVEENNLNQTISALRRALGAGTSERRYIVTEPGRGYRFIAEVRMLTGADAAASGGEKIEAATKAAAADSASPAPGPKFRVRSIAAAAGIAAIALAAVWYWRQPVGDLPVHTTTLAVLPFKPLRSEDRDEVLELGMADSLIAKLSNSRHLVVRSLNSVRRFNRLDQDPLAAARVLDVGTVLEGQIQKNDGHVRLTARLLDVPTGMALWTGTFDEKFVDVFVVQDTVAEKVASALALQLDSAEERAMSAHHTRNVDAYELYLNGRYHIGKATPAEINMGIAFFRKAIDLDPTYALAYAAMAESFRRLPITGDVDPKEAFPLAKAAAIKALEIDENVADAHSVLGWVALWYDWDWQNAETEFRRAIALNPNVTEAHLGYGGLLSNTGRHAQALQEARRGRELDPLSPVVTTVAANYFAAAGEFDEARRLLDKALDADRNFWIAHLTLGWLDLSAERYENAIVEFTKARDGSGGSLQAVSMLGFAFARNGQTKEAHAILDDLKLRTHTQYVPATALATVYAGLGESDNALEWLTRAYDDRDVRMPFLKVDHRWDALRGDSRFIAIARRMKLE